MAKFDHHPTVKWWREQSINNRPTSTTTLNADSLRSLCLEAGADDVEFVEIDRSAIKERNLVWALLRRKIRIHGSPKLLQAFGKCFPA